MNKIYLYFIYLLQTKDSQCLHEVLPGYNVQDVQQVVFKLNGSFVSILF